MQAENGSEEPPAEHVPNAVGRAFGSALPFAVFVGCSSAVVRAWKGTPMIRKSIIVAATSMVPFTIFFAFQQKMAAIRRVNDVRCSAVAGAITGTLVGGLRGPKPAVAATAVLSMTAATIHAMYNGAWNTYYNHFRQKTLASTQSKLLNEPETTSWWFDWMPIQKITDEEYREHQGRLQKMEEIMKDLHEYEQKNNSRRSDMKSSTLPNPSDSEDSG